MPKPRETLVSVEATPYYHCASRCKAESQDAHHANWLVGILSYILFSEIGPLTSLILYQKQLTLLHYLSFIFYVRFPTTQPCQSPESARYRPLSPP